MLVTVVIVAVPWHRTLAQDTGTGHWYRTLAQDTGTGSSSSAAVTPVSVIPPTLYNLGSWQRR